MARQVLRRGAGQHRVWAKQIPNSMERYHTRWLQSLGMGNVQYYLGHLLLTFVPKIKMQSEGQSGRAALVVGQTYEQVHSSLFCSERLLCERSPLFMIPSIFDNSIRPTPTT